VVHVLENARFSNENGTVNRRIWGHLLPAKLQGVGQILPGRLEAVILITVHPESLAADVLRMVRTVVALGGSAGDVVSTFCKAAGLTVPDDLSTLGEDEVLVFSAGDGAQPVKAERPAQTHKRHIRKYAEGELGPDRSFYFRGPDGALNLRAQNLAVFLQMAAGVDDGAWDFHRRAGDYSKWFRNAIKNDELADEAAKIEQDSSLDAQGSRKCIAEAVSRRYTAPAKREP